MILSCSDSMWSMVRRMRSRRWSNVMQGWSMARRGGLCATTIWPRRSRKLFLSSSRKKLPVLNELPLSLDGFTAPRVLWPWRRFELNSAGGNTVYATDVEGRIVYYYAHLDHYRESLAAGMPLAKGDTIGFVGTTGNAPKDIPHLHFQIMRMPHDGKYWNGEPINPFAILRGEAERP